MRERADPWNLELGSGPTQDPPPMADRVFLQDVQRDAETGNVWAHGLPGARTVARDCSLLRSPARHQSLADHLRVFKEPWQDAPTVQNSMEMKL